MTTSIRTWPDSLFYLSRAGTANVLEQIKKTQLAAELLRVLSDASTVDTNGDKLQDRLLGTSYGDLNQRHKWRVLYDNTNDRLLVQRNTGTDASKVWSERFRIDASGNVTTTGTLSATAVTVREVEGLTLGGDLDMNGFYIRNAEDIQTDTIRVTGQSTFQNNHGLAWVYITSKTASSAAVIDFTGLSDYPAYMVTLEGIRPGTDAVSLLMLTSSNNGASFDVSANYDTSGSADAFPSSAVIVSIGANSWNLTGGTSTQDNAAASALSGSVRINSLGSASLSARIRVEVEWVESTGVLFVNTLLAGRKSSASAINAIRFLYSSGNITSGTFRLYGLRSS